ncbi:hypothetical protein [Acinetobacter sp. SWBY1]|uniref:hypothetical protein n=1 Tax=Acinetobacter sp. SWBY1 TaxID=2079596 RepID=UPI001BC892D1|nr:hypothetical protein [Acinetobacter sp. SWBY1]
MAVSEQTPYIEYTANGTATSFELEFDCDNRDHLIVLVDDIEPVVGAWSLSNGAVVFNTAPENGKKITLQRNTPFSRTTDYQSYNNSFRPPAVNKDFDWIWLKLQELGVADYLLRLYVDRLHGEQKTYIDQKDTQLQENISNLASYVGQKDVELQGNIDNLKDYVDDKDDELRAYLLAEIQAQGVALDQLDEYYNYLMQRLAQIAVDGGWDSSFVVHKDTNQYEINEFVYPKLQRENMSVWDFFTDVELTSYKAAPTTFDAYRPIQEFFDYIAANDVGTAYCNGSFRTSQGIVFGGSAGSKTKMVIGYFTITALNAIDTMFTAYTGQSFVWSGSINAHGTGSVSYASRTCRVGIKWGGVYTSSRNAITNIVVSRFSQVGLSCNNLTTLTNFGDVKASDCGSGWVSGSLSANFSNRIDSGSSGSTSAKSKITVDVLPPEVLETHLHVIIGGELFFVDSVDRENKTLNLNTWFDLTLQTGSLRYLFGAGVLSSGGDSSVNKFAKIDATRCSYGYLCQSLYPPFVDNLVGQYCGVVFGIGQSPASASLGGAIGNLYCEASEFEVARLTRADLSFSILSTGPSNLSRSTRANNGRLSSNTSGITTAAFKSLSMGYYGSVLSSEQAIYATTNGSIDIVNQDRSPVRYFTNNLNVNIATPRLDLIRLFAYDFRKLVVFGTSSANNFTPTTVTFNAPSGYTVNGQASVTFTNFSCVAEFDVALYRGTTDFLVALVGNVIKQATVTYDPPSLAAGTRDVIQTMTVTGANLGDNVNMSFDKDLQGVSLIGYVSAANTVSYYFENRTDDTVDLVSGTVKAKIV